MPEIQVGYGQAQMAINLPGDLEPMTVGMGFKLTDPPSFVESDADFFCNAFADAVNGTMTQAYETTGCTMVVGLPLGDFEFFSQEGCGPGIVNQPACPQNVATLVKKGSILAGRKHRGRCFIPGVPEQNVDELGQYTTTALTAVQTLWGTFFGNVSNEATFEHLAILHAVGDATEATEITTLLVDRRVATQRRRLRR